MQRYKVTRTVHTEEVWEVNAESKVRAVELVRALNADLIQSTSSEPRVIIETLGVDCGPRDPEVASPSR